jgi:hypothetical protein
MHIYGIHLLVQIKVTLNSNKKKQFISWCCSNWRCDRLDGLGVVAKMPMELAIYAAFQFQEAGLAPSGLSEASSTCGQHASKIRTQELVSQSNITHVS